MVLHVDNVEVPLGGCDKCMIYLDENMNSYENEVSLYSYEIYGLVGYSDISS